MTLLKREKELILKIRPAYVHSPEMEEVARIFHLTPGLSKYRIKSELTEEANAETPEPAGKRHDLPEPAVGVADHDLPVQGGVRPRGARAVGHRADDARSGRRAFRLDAGHRRELPCPRAEAPSPRTRRWPSTYRGYWFYIAPRRREVARGPGHPRDPVRTPGIGREERRPAAHPPARRVRDSSRRVRRSVDDGRLEGERGRPRGARGQLVERLPAGGAVLDLGLDEPPLRIAELLAQEALEAVPRRAVRVLRSVPVHYRPLRRWISASMSLHSLSVPGARPPAACPARPGRASRPGRGRPASASTSSTRLRDPSPDRRPDPRSRRPGLPASSPAPACGSGHAPPRPASRHPPRRAPARMATTGAWLRTRVFRSPTNRGRVARASAWDRAAAAYRPLIRHRSARSRPSATSEAVSLPRRMAGSRASSTGGRGTVAVPRSHPVAGRHRAGAGRGPCRWRPSPRSGAPGRAALAQGPVDRDGTRG